MSEAPIPPDPRDYIYDIETYPNVFTIAIKHVVTGQRWMFEISPWKNDILEILQMFAYLKAIGARMVGFNNDHFDYPVIHIITHPQVTAEELYEKAQAIFRDGNNPNTKFKHTVWANKRHVEQIDLFKIWHLDNKAKSARLKDIEFHMRMLTIQDLPIKPGTVLTFDQTEKLKHYNMYGDVDATELFYFKTLAKIKFREELGEKYGMDFMNANDTKIGEMIFIDRLEKASPGVCYVRTNGKRVKRQTIRPILHLREAVFPYIKFEQPAFNKVKSYIEGTSVKKTKGVFKGLTAEVNGFTFVFGTGGIHGSVEGTTLYTDDEKVIIDLDVASYYPNIVIKNKLRPDHIGELFCEIYNDMYVERRGYPKSNPNNKALKDALNGGGFGKTNSVYSALYDPLMTMKTTLNGQFMLCMFAEELFKIPGLEMIQINTDGLTVRCPRYHIPDLMAIRSWWEDYTCLELEEAVYSRMFISDVNNYIAEYEGGKLKNKGKYVHDLSNDIHKDPSQLVVAKLAERALVNGEDIRTMVYAHEDDADFMLRAKVKGKDILLDGSDNEIQKVSRFYVGIEGTTIIKRSPVVEGAVEGQWKRKNGIGDDYYETVRTEVMSDTYWSDDPDSKMDPTGAWWDERINTKSMSIYGERETQIASGRKAVICNDTLTIDRHNLDYEYYIKEIEKLVLPLL